MKSRLLLVLLPLLLLSACWDSKDINKRALPIALGISKNENHNYKVGLRIPEPHNSSTNIRYVQAEAPTIGQAIERIRMKMADDIDLLHLKLILISEPLAKEGLRDIVEYAMQSNSIQPKAMVAIVRSDMSKFLSSMDEDGEEAGQGLSDFFSKQAGWTPHIATAKIWEVYRALYFYTEDIAIPILNKDEETMFQFVGSAILHEKKMVDSITPDETLLYNIFQGKYDDAHMEVMNHASVLVVDANVKMKATGIEQTPKVSSKLKVVVTIEEMKEGTMQSVIEEELSKLLKKRFDLLTKKLKTNHSDILGFGQRFRNQMSDAQLKAWRDDIYPKLETELRVEVVIRNEGSIKSEIGDVKAYKLEPLKGRK
ncbi:Ger(x)C family germination protein [Paenibacillus endophyticus]|uniref:Ger(X)C family germination protein n=1 Tax=Paenibacillus endophyticus TaxID=1294268 RepID=A0A7W5CDV2_9BACL|nr:Ger(x)C family spore germination protein [Paenibacillus endophyticus]MBB3155863.1 Ger(x)C family germination protein [Paenibacillus endophyticus]